MDYTLEEIYALIGKDNRTANLTFKINSQAYIDYGSYITVELLYEPNQRIELDSKIQKKPYSEVGFIKAKYLGSSLSKEKIQKLKSEGVLSSDIISISYYNGPVRNTFHSLEKREIQKVNIPLQPMPKGKDLEWVYGFKKRLIEEGTILCPEDRIYYLALKYYFEEDKITEDELEEIFNSDSELEKFEWEYLRIKLLSDDISEGEKSHLEGIMERCANENIRKLGKHLNDAGTSLKKLTSENLELAVQLVTKAISFEEIQINIEGNMPIYLDFVSFFHIFLRHVEEMQVTNKFEHKDNFQWDENDILTVIRQIIGESNSEIQEFFKTNPGKRFSKYKHKSPYYEGDYYTYHIEPNGRISTIHKNRKQIKKIIK